MSEMPIETFLGIEDQSVDPVDFQRVIEAARAYIASIPDLPPGMSEDERVLYLMGLQDPYY